MTQELISLLASGMSFGITAALGKKVIPWLHKLKYGQTIKKSARSGMRKNRAPLPWAD